MNLSLSTYFEIFEKLLFWTYITALEVQYLDVKMHLLVSTLTSLKAIEACMKSFLYREIGVKIGVPVFWNILKKITPMIFYIIGVFDLPHPFNQILLTKACLKNNHSGCNSNIQGICPSEHWNNYSFTFKFIPNI